VIKEEKKESSDEELLDHKHPKGGAHANDSDNSDESVDSSIISDSSCLNSEDEVSPEEEDEYTLPDGYKFYAERIGEAEHAFKKFKHFIYSGSRKMKYLIAKLRSMDKRSL
jgi:hypothetical protein